MMGTLVHLQLYTFSYRKAVIQPQNVPKTADDGVVAHCCAIFHLLGQLTNGGLAQGLGGEQRPHPLCGTKDATGHRAGA